MSVSGKYNKVLAWLMMIIIIMPMCGSFELQAQSKKGNTEKKVSVSKGSSKKGGSGTLKKGVKKKQSQKGKNSEVKTSAEAKRQAEATQKEIKKTKEEIRQNEKSIKMGLAELGRLEGSISMLKQEVDRTDAELSALNNDISNLENEIEISEKKLKTLLDSYKKSVKKIRATKNSKSDLAFIFSAGNFSQMLRRLRYLREVSQWREKQSSQIAENVRKLRERKEELGSICLAKDATLRRQQASQNKLKGEYARQDAIVVELKKNGTQLQSHLAKKQAEANALRNRISQLIDQEQAAAKAAEEKRKKEQQLKEKQEEQRRREAELKEQQRKEDQQKEVQAKESASTKSVQKDEKPVKQKTEKKPTVKAEKAKDDKVKSDKSSYATARNRKPRGEQDKGEVAKKEVSRSEKSEPAKASGFENMKGKLPRPVDGTFRITGKFGRHSLPDLPSVMYDNPGIDVEVGVGASAKAVYAGKVSGVYMVPGFNTVVIVSHGNYYTVYGNIANPSVKTGDVVKAGQRVGVVANDVDDNSHGLFHFEVWKNREKQDPMIWLGK